MKCSKIKILLAITLAFGAKFSVVSAQQKNDSVITPKSSKINILYGKQDYNRFVGNTDAVKGEDLLNYPAVSVQEALAGQLPGLFILQNNGNPGEDNFSMY
ncbi:MAG: hypothetical protein WCJ61_15660, partial [Paludibacter sp.]